MKLKNITLAAAMLTTFGLSTAAIAGTQAILTVTGSITPPSCDISFDGGGALDFGEINPELLSADKSTSLGTKSTKLNVSCDSPTLFALKSTDVAEKAGEALINGKNAGVNFSLGATNGGKLIGAYHINTTAPGTQVDGAAAAGFAYSANNAQTWTKGAEHSWENSGTELMAVANGTDIKPIAAKNVSFGMSVTPYISPASDLGSTDDITLAGNATFDLVYL
ncbi:DUF1120 domain-containing protein [Erwinia sp. AnSW2-5]|uniref:DUF1120 domain-containing protein n=1 Tax=Erwinia sp. AnSW2-5 TaxID=3367692 RepID=UPI00385A0DDE